MSHAHCILLPVTIDPRKVQQITSSAQQLTVLRVDILSKSTNILPSGENYSTFFLGVATRSRSLITMAITLFYCSTGEYGKPINITEEKLSPAERTKFNVGWKRNAFNQYASDMMSLHRSLPDFRDEEYVLLCIICSPHFI